VELKQNEVHMSEEDLELLVTLDDPEDLEKEDTFHDLKADNTVVASARSAATSRRPDEQTEVIAFTKSEIAAAAFRR
jgi:hypothetical protein